MLRHTCPFIILRLAWTIGPQCETINMTNIKHHNHLYSSKIEALNYPVTSGCTMVPLVVWPCLATCLILLFFADPWFIERAVCCPKKLWRSSNRKHIININMLYCIYREINYGFVSKIGFSLAQRGQSSWGPR